MDERAFDALARSLTQPAARRAAFKVLLGGVGGAALVALGVPDAAARCGRVGQRCDEGSDCCSGAKCRRREPRKCVCKAGLKECDGRCRDLDNSRNHCGACNNKCLSNEVCQSGDCCRPSFTLCTDVCAKNSNCDACCSGFCFSDNTC